MTPSQLKVAIMRCLRKYGNPMTARQVAESEEVLLDPTISDTIIKMPTPQIRSLVSDALSKMVLDRKGFATLHRQQHKSTNEPTTRWAYYIGEPSKAMPLSTRLPRRTSNGKVKASDLVAHGIIKTLPTSPKVGNNTPPPNPQSDRPRIVISKGGNSLTVSTERVVITIEL